MLGALAEAKAPALDVQAIKDARRFIDCRYCGGHGCAPGRQFVARSHPSGGQWQTRQALA
jgi:hypothetical protein